MQSPTRAARMWAPRSLVLLLLIAAISFSHQQQQQQQQKPQQSLQRVEQRRRGVARFFSSLDANVDGQLQAGELAAFLSASIGPDGQRLAGRELERAVARSTDALDSGDASGDISLAEMEAALHRALQVRQCAQERRDSGLQHRVSQRWCLCRSG